MKLLLSKTLEFYPKHRWLHQLSTNVEDWTIVHSPNMLILRERTPPGAHPGWYPVVTALSLPDAACCISQHMGDKSRTIEFPWFKLGHIRAATMTLIIDTFNNFEQYSELYAKCISCMKTAAENINRKVTGESDCPSIDWNLTKHMDFLMLRQVIHRRSLCIIINAHNGECLVYQETHVLQKMTKDAKFDSFRNVLGNRHYFEWEILIESSRGQCAQ